MEFTMDEEKNKDLIAATEADFHNVRNTLMQGCQIVMEGMRNSLKNHNRFMNRVHELENVFDYGKNLPAYYLQKNAKTGVEGIAVTRNFK